MSKKKFIALVLTVAMLLSTTMFGVYAESEIEPFGECGHYNSNHTPMIEREPILAAGYCYRELIYDVETCYVCGTMLQTTLISDEWLTHDWSDYEYTCYHDGTDDKIRYCRREYCGSEEIYEVITCNGDCECEECGYN